MKYFKLKKNRARFLALAMIGAVGMTAAASAVCYAKEEAKTETDFTSFETTDIHETEYSEEIFADYELTLVNIFATWCMPCVQEMPELEKLYQEMEDQGINVVGIVSDCLASAAGSSEALETAKLLEEKLETTYPLLIPDETCFGTYLETVMAFPTTVFVDSEGKIVSEVYEGSRNLEGWKEIVEKELKNLEDES